MHVFYAPDIAQTMELPEEEAGHCLRVLRLGVGEEITLTDGKVALSGGHFGRHAEALCGEGGGENGAGAFLERASAPGTGTYQEHGPHGMAGGKGHGNRFRRADFPELPFFGTEGHQDGTGGENRGVGRKAVAQGAQAGGKRDDGFPPLHGAGIYGAEVHCALL